MSVVGQFNHTLHCTQLYTVAKKLLTVTEYIFDFCALMCLTCISSRCWQVSHLYRQIHVVWLASWTVTKLDGKHTNLLLPDFSLPLLDVSPQFRNRFFPRDSCPIYPIISLTGVGTIWLFNLDEMNCDTACANWCLLDVEGTGWELILFSSVSN